METRLRYPKLDRVIYPDQALPVATAVQEGLIPDADPETLRAVEEAGYPVVNFDYRLTSDSRHPVTVPVVCRDKKVVARPPHTTVQTLGLAAGRRTQGATWSDWDSTPHVTARVDGDGRYISGTVEDGRWRERVGDQTREWVIEYSHGEFTFGRLANVVQRHGQRPQLWLTPSRAHALKIERVLAEVLPGYPHRRVLVVDWTGGVHDLP